MGKPIAGGIPTGAYGITDELAAGVLENTLWDAADVGGVGGTLAGNALRSRRSGPPSARCSRRGVRAHDRARPSGSSPG